MRGRENRLLELEKAVAAGTGDLLASLDELTTLYLNRGEIDKANQTSDDMVMIASGRRKRARDPRNVVTVAHPKRSKLQLTARQALMLPLMFFALWGLGGLATPRLNDLAIDTVEQAPWLSVAISKCTTTLSPKNSSYFFTLGYALQRSANNREAVEVYTRAIELDPDCGCSHNNRGLAYECLGDLKNAKADYILGVILHPADYRHHSYLAGLLLQENKPEAALKSFSRAIAAAAAPGTDATDTDRADLYEQYAGALTRLNRKTEAAEALKRAKQLRR